MATSLAPGPQSYTYERLQKLWRGRHDFRPSNQQSASQLHSLQYNKDFCLRLYASVRDPANHLSRLDEEFPSMRPNLFETKVPEKEIVTFAYDILARLPAEPLNLFELIFPADLHLRELKQYVDQHVGKHHAPLNAVWNDLQVVSWVSTAVLRLALIIAWVQRGKILGSAPGDGLLDGTVALLKVAFGLSSKAETIEEKARWLVVQAFLWTTWQRGSMLHLWAQLDGQFEEGFDYERNSSLSLRDVTSVPELGPGFARLHLENRTKTPYMCSWAYELLKADRACVTHDFRRFLERHASLCGAKPARCLAGEKQCDGRSPEDCQRFVSINIVDQSAHDWTCRGDCKRLYWDRSSFISVSGAEAVCLATTDDDTLRYREASGQTLAISHVWSHCQGGRPDTTGMNSCLHQRYANLASSFQCDSYWMDTPCIPDEKELKAKCIKNINKIFAQAKAVVVCDEDIMEIDVHNLDIDLQESILALLFVRDWNIRAWTLLEAMRGRNNLYLLCKWNEVICLREVIRAVHERGRIDLAILFSAAQHLLPHVRPRDWELFPGQGTVATEEMLAAEKGFLNAGEASILLYRHLSRDGDDTIIWSFLVSESASKDPAKIWKTQEGRRISTGFLLSSAPRVQGCPGLSWAPNTPTVRLPKADKNLGTDGKTHLAFDSNDTQDGTVTSEGLKAHWLVHRFIVSAVSNEVSDRRSASFINNGPSSLDLIIRKYLRDSTNGALLRPCNIRGNRKKPALYRGNAQGPLVVVCSFRHTDHGYSWKGVFEWGVGEALPDFAYETVLLV